MREIPSLEPYSRPEKRERLETAERREVVSLLAGPNGEHEKLSVAIAEDGAARRVNFWDLDKTLLWAHDVQLAAILKEFPEAAALDPKDLQDTCEAGWRLGNSCREFDRMHRIYIEGSSQYRDPVVYEKEFILNEENRKRIDGPGYPEGWHERAAALLARHDTEGSAILEEMYRENPDSMKSDGFLIPAMVHLLKAKVRLGEVNAFMTANPRNLAHGLVKYSGLYKYGFDIGTDEDMIGGGKEVILEKLIQRIETHGIRAPRDRLVVLGDSERGDIGSGYKLKDKGYTFQGVLVRKDTAESEVFKRAAQSDPELQEMLTNMDITLIASDDVPTIDGVHKLGRLGSAAATRKAQKNKES